MSEEDGWDLNWFDLPVIKPINFPDDYEDDDDVDQLTVEAEKSIAVADAATVDDNDTGTVVTQVDSLTQIDSVPQIDSVTQVDRLTQIDSFGICDSRPSDVPFHTLIFPQPDSKPIPVAIETEDSVTQSVTDSVVNSPPASSQSTSSSIASQERSPSSLDIDKAVGNSGANPDTQSASPTITLLPPAVVNNDHTLGDTGAKPDGQAAPPTISFLPPVVMMSSVPTPSDRFVSAQVLIRCPLCLILLEGHATFFQHLQNTRHSTAFPPGKTFIRVICAVTVAPASPTTEACATLDSFLRCIPPVQSVVGDVAAFRGLHYPRSESAVESKCFLVQRLD